MRFAVRTVTSSWGVGVADAKSRHNVLFDVGGVGVAECIGCAVPPTCRWWKKTRRRRRVSRSCPTGCRRALGGGYVVPSEHAAIFLTPTSSANESVLRASFGFADGHCTGEPVTVFAWHIVPMPGSVRSWEVPKSVGQLQNCTGDGIRSAWPVWKNPRASFS